MINKFFRFQIPTLLGLAVIILGMGAGVYLVVKQQAVTTQAAPDKTPQNIAISNIEDDTVTISWQTKFNTASFIRYGQQSPTEQTKLDDQDSSVPTPRLLHYATLKNLTPETDYQFIIVTGGISTIPIKFTTALPSQPNNFPPVIGLVLDGNEPLQTGVVFLNIEGMATQSALIKNYGNFIIPLSFARREDLSAVFTPQIGATAKITVVAEINQAQATIELTDSDQPVGPLILGRNINFAVSNVATTSASKKFDLNKDGQVNSNDYSIIIDNFGKKPKNKSIDLNSDGIINNKDLELILDQISEPQTP